MKLTDNKNNKMGLPFATKMGTWPLISYQRVFLEFLRQVQKRGSYLISDDVDIAAEYSIGSYFRRVSDTRDLIV